MAFLLVVKVVAKPLLRLLRRKPPEPPAGPPKPTKTNEKQNKKQNKKHRLDRPLKKVNCLENDILKKLLFLLEIIVIKPYDLRRCALAGFRHAESEFAVTQSTENGKNETKNYRQVGVWKKKNNGTVRSHDDSR